MVVSAIFARRRCSLKGVRNIAGIDQVCVQSYLERVLNAPDRLSYCDPEDADIRKAITIDVGRARRIKGLVSKRAFSRLLDFRPDRSYARVMDRIYELEQKTAAASLKDVFRFSIDSRGAGFEITDHVCERLATRFLGKKDGNFSPEEYARLRSTIAGDLFQLRRYLGYREALAFAPPNRAGLIPDQKFGQLGDRIYVLAGKRGTIVKTVLQYEGDRRCLTGLF